MRENSKYFLKYNCTKDCIYQGSQIYLFKIQAKSLTNL